jgi:hypothetical protein
MGFNSAFKGLNSNTRDGILSGKRKASGLFHYPDDRRWLRYSYGGWWERRPAGLRAGLQTLLSKEDFLHLFIFLTFETLVF